MTKKLLKEYMIDWINTWYEKGNVIVDNPKYNTELCEYLADKIWDKIKPSKQDLFNSVYPISDWFDHAP